MNLYYNERIRDFIVSEDNDIEDYHLINNAPVSEDILNNFVELHNTTFNFRKNINYATVKFNFNWFIKFRKL